MISAAVHVLIYIDVLVPKVCLLVITLLAAYFYGITIECYLFWKILLHTCVYNVKYYWTSITLYCTNSGNARMKYTRKIKKLHDNNMHNFARPGRPFVMIIIYNYL